MKPIRLETTLIATTICALTALSSPVNAASWVTVNPDGSVTRTEVQSPYDDAAPQDQSTLNGLPTLPLPTSQLPNTPADAMTYQASRGNSQRVANGKITAKNGKAVDHTAGYYYPGAYPAPQPYPNYPYYPGYAPAPGGYYGGTYTTTTPAPAYSGPIGPPGSRGAWINVIPLGGTVTTYNGYHTPSYLPPCPPAPGYAPPYPGYPAYGQPVYGQPAYNCPPYGQPTYGYPSYPPYPTYGTYGANTSTYGQVSVGNGRFNVTIGGSRSTSGYPYNSTQTTTQTTTVFGR